MVDDFVDLRITELIQLRHLPEMVNECLVEDGSSKRHRYVAASAAELNPMIDNSLTITTIYWLLGLLRCSIAREACCRTMVDSSLTY